MRTDYNIGVSIGMFLGISATIFFCLGILSQIIWNSTLGAIILIVLGLLVLKSRYLEIASGMMYVSNMKIPDEDKMEIAVDILGCPSAIASKVLLKKPL